VAVVAEKGRLERRSIAKVTQEGREGWRSGERDTKHVGWAAASRD
jgi:hypothetical protein